MNKKYSVMQLSLGGIFAAMICIATMLLQIPVSLTHGYIHLGDALILLGASILGPVSIAAAGIGSMLADLLSGYAVYCLPTMVIKGLMAVIVLLGLRNSSSLLRACLWYVIAELWMVLGYFLVEWLILGYGLAAATGAVVPNLVQGLSGIVFAAILFIPSKKIFQKL